MPRTIIELMSSRKDRGFTLIELLITLTIIGVLASLALPAYSSFVAGQRIKSASFDMMAMLTLARSEAIKRNATVTSTPGSDWSQGWTVTAADGTVLSRQNALPGITVICMQGSPLTAATCTSLSYNLNGRSGGNVQSIQITSTATNSTRCISIDLSGRPNSKRGNC